MKRVDGHRKHREKRKGFTILEVMIAFTILVIGVMAIVPITVFMYKSNVHNKRLSSAKFLAEEYAENFRAVDYGNIQLQDDADTSDLFDIDTPDHADTTTMQRDTFYVMWNIAENVPSAGIKSINIIVAWDDRTDNSRHQINFLTYKAAVSR